MLLFPIEFYVPRNELDATKEIMYNSINMSCQNGKKKDSTRSRNSTKQKELHLGRYSVLHVFYSCLIHNLLLTNNVFNYCAFSKLYSTFKYTILKLLENKTSYSYCTYTFFIFSKLFPNNPLYHSPKQIKNQKIRI